MSDSSLFKATRRSIRAEVTLLIVIVISFSWSAYALYKLALGSSDSLLDFGLSQAKANQQVATQLNQSKPDHETVQLDVSNPSEQLAKYKSQILKELLARQRQLLYDDSIDRYRAAQPDSLNYQRSQPSPTAVGRPQREQFEKTVTPVDIEELKQWRGGFRMPATIDYLFDTSKQAAMGLKTGSQIDRIPSSSNDHAQGTVNSALIPLTNAPSLMQLSKSKLAEDPNSETQIRHAKELKLWHNDDELNEHERNRPRTPEGEASDDNSLVTERQSQNEVTFTTTIPPTSYEQESVETTTIEPTSDVASDETTPSPINETNEEEDSKKDERVNDYQDQASPDQHQDLDNKDNRDTSNESNDDDDGSIERVKNTVHAIDEEVDRMTQPSLGMASQQDKSFDYKNTVQFDDGLPGATQRELDQNIKNKVPKYTDESFQLGEYRAGRRKSETSDDTDLQVADNKSKSPIGVMHAAGPLTPVQKRALKEKKEGMKSNGMNLLSMHELQNYNGTRSRNTKNSIRILQEPNSEARLRQKRSAETNLISKTLDSIDSKTRRKKNRKSLRRSDDQDESDEDNRSDSHEDDDRGEPETQHPPEGQVSPVEKLRNSYQTITSNDPTLQELLAHKRLLDELQQSQVPAPVTWPQNSAYQIKPQLERMNSTSIESSIQNHGLMVGEAKAGSPDHQPADTHYTVDHGLLLYPAEDEEHHHKSMSKKSKKASHKKAKKKMTVAMKKGGHKKKKHKKEEKKYLKEKKFKGAKKGKKMSKGKGGKGGKKGKKYYKDKGFKKKGFKNIYVKNEFGQKKSYFDEFRDKDFKKKWKNFDDKYNYAQMKKWQAKDVKGAKKMKDQGEHYKKYDKGKWKKKYHKHQQSESAKKKKKQDEF